MIKKFFYNLLIVSIVIFILDFTIGRTLRHFYFKQTSGSGYLITYSMQRTQADILIFGSSRANHHYVPEIFEDSLNMTFYNAGKDGQSILYHNAILKSVIKRYTPKLIILDYMRDLEKGEKAYDRLTCLLPYYRTQDNLKELIDSVSPFERIKLMSEIYPFNSQILSIAYGNLTIGEKRYDGTKGYLPLYKEWQLKIDTISNVSYEVDSFKLKTFQDFIKTAKNSNAELIVIYSPIYRKYEKNSDIELCSKICCDENVSFWDFSEDTLFLNNKQFFQDVTHLNNNGAKIFSYLVINKIKYTNKIKEPQSEQRLLH